MTGTDIGNTCLFREEKAFFCPGPIASGERVSNLWR